MGFRNLEAPRTFGVLQGTVSPAAPANNISLFGSFLLIPPYQISVASYLLPWQSYLKKFSYK
ncbi:MAG: hypothetical protein MRERC_5c081 [Mycoplasmataceae bacterium RC_NB112A]|nr:MAG: hypothetical protein MRERC_5c081 [Mycoplasmataceae bacterium RC_NB112A]